MSFTFQNSLLNSPIFTPEDIIQGMYLESFQLREMIGELRRGSLFLFGTTMCIYINYMIDGHHSTHKFINFVLLFFVSFLTIVKLS